MRIIFLFILLTASAVRAEDNGYVEELIAHARAAGLAQDRQWQTLLHFEGSRSKAEPGSFFLSPHGCSDFQAEMDATLRAFFSQEDVAERKEPAQCAFPARYLWLKEKLGFDPARLAEQSCPTFRNWYGGIQPHSLTLILASSYMNNPASAFGHTLLRIDRAGSDPNSRLLDYAVNYAATTDDANALLYAMKGIGGGYDGFFSVEPYYQKVKEYSDLENRDIWEYPLNLTPDEVDLLVRHLWELQGVPFAYYYFDENCSYQLLSLLEVARPSLRLRSQFNSWVIPVDTIRALLKETDAASPIFRPSAATKLQNRIHRASSEVRTLSKNLVREGGVRPERAGLDSLAESLDLANEYLAYILIGTTDEDERKELADKAFALLGDRSRVPQPDLVPTPAIPGTSPEAGHSAKKLSLGGGLKEDKVFFHLSLRPTYHDLLDPEGGYSIGSQISMLRTDIGFPDEQEPRLERFDALDLASLTPRNSFLKPTSWYFRLGAERSESLPRENDLIYLIKGGGGVAFRLFEKSLLYALAGPGLYSGRHLEHNFAVGVGARLGTLLFLSERAAMLADFGYERILPHNDLDIYAIDIGRRYTITSNWAQRLTQKLTWTDSQFSSRYLFTLETFF